MKTPIPEIIAYIKKQLDDTAKNKRLKEDEKYRVLCDVSSYLCDVDNESREYSIHVKIVQFDDGLYGMLDLDSDPAEPKYLSFVTDYCWSESHDYFPTECKRPLYAVFKRAEALEARNKRSKINRFTVE